MTGPKKKVMVSGCFDPLHAGAILERGPGFPYRICLAGGWMDQPWVSRFHPGSVVVVQILPTIEFNERSGMATSSRKIAIELWGNRFPAGDPVRNARLLFGAENPPGTEYVSGSQDHLGLMLPGISRLFYRGNYWPERIDSTCDKDIVAWLERVLHLIPVKPRPAKYDPIDKRNLTVEGVRELGESGDLCWRSILDRDAVRLGQSLRLTLEAWKKLLPHTVLPDTLDDLKQAASYPGAIFSGSGGGYLVVVSEKPVSNALKVRVRTG
jgi:hypothetical protein